jgi:hypothetical protein
MDRPYVRWGHVPVYVRAIDQEFIRVFVRGVVPPDPKSQKPDDFPSPIMLDVTPEWESIPSWHERQAEAAINAAIKAYPDGLKIIPSKGFYVSVWRRWTPGVQKPDIPAPEGRSSAVSRSARIRGISTSAGSATILWEVTESRDFRGVRWLGQDFNPYPELFSQIISGLRRAWLDWVARRRLKRWKPEPGWLVDLRRVKQSKKRCIS